MELAGVLDLEDTAEVWTELEAEGLIELEGVLEVEGTAEVACELETKVEETTEDEADVILVESELGDWVLI